MHQGGRSGDAAINSSSDGRRTRSGDGGKVGRGRASHDTLLDHALT